MREWSDYCSAQTPFEFSRGASLMDGWIYVRSPYVCVRGLGEKERGLLLGDPGGAAVVCASLLADRTQDRTLSLWGAKNVGARW